MKNWLILILLMGSGLAMAGTPAQNLKVDMTGRQFSNYCEGEQVSITSGQLNVVYRMDFGGDVNGVHLLTKTAGSFRATGNTTGNSYLVNITGNAPSILPVSVNNLVNGQGTSNLLVHIEMVNLSDPGSGVSQVKAVIVFVVDGTGFGDQKVLEVSMNCIGK